MFRIDCHKITLYEKDWVIIKERRNVMMLNYGSKFELVKVHELIYEMKMEKNLELLYLETKKENPRLEGTLEEFTEMYLRLFGQMFQNTSSPSVRNGYLSFMQPTSKDDYEREFSQLKEMDSELDKYILMICKKTA